MADDFSSLARDLGEIPKATAPFVRKAVEISARNIKDQIKRDYTGSRNLPGAAGSISYELKGTTGQILGGISAEIGPRLGGQGSVVGLVDKGTVNNPGKNRIPKALADEEQGFADGIRKAVQDGMEAAGL